MSVNLLRTGVGVESIDHLHELQSHFKTREDDQGQVVVVLTTRNTPTRANELMSGGSVYWIIKRQIQARQKILDVSTIKDEDGKNMCQILLEPQIHRLSPLPHKHIQGWRYLDHDKAPKDAGLYIVGEEQAPEDMAAELRELGLL